MAPIQLYITFLLIFYLSLPVDLLSSLLGVDQIQQMEGSQV
jgi:hypothetical protein